MDVLNYAHINNYAVYTKGEKIIHNSFRMKNWGFNLSSYFKFIIDNYENLPDRICFIKNNVYPRHVDKKIFEKSLRLKNPFVGIDDYSSLKLVNKVSYYNEFGFHEINNSWYMTSKNSKYFMNLDHFMNFFFLNYERQKFINFVPGANFIIDKALIIKYPKGFYESLNRIMKHTQNANESHLIERAIKLIWTKDLLLRQKYHECIDEKTLCVLSKKLQILRKLRLLKPYNKLKYYENI